MRTTLTVIYTTRLQDCRDFYARLGLPLQAEQHGTGPEHYAAVLEDGSVLELYPAGKKEPTGRVRLGFATTSAPGLKPGHHVLTDPDGRAVEVTIEGGTVNRTDALTLIGDTLGETGRCDVRELPDGGISATIETGGRIVVVDGRDKSGWGWSIDPDEAEAFTGHAHQAGTLADALTGIRAALG